jgi:hypothetical protein
MARGPGATNVEPIIGAARAGAQWARDHGAVVGEIVHNRQRRFEEMKQRAIRAALTAIA